MDGLFWFGVLGLPTFGMILARGVVRAKAHVAAQLDLKNLQGPPFFNPRFIDALRDGDPTEIAKAPQPEFFSEERIGILNALFSPRHRARPLSA